MRKSCVIYKTWADQLINLPSDVAGEYIQAILKYAFYGEEIKSDNPFINAMLVPVKEKLDEDIEKYQAKVDRAKAISERNRNDIETKSKRYRNEIVGVTDTDTVTVTVTDKKNKRSSFGDFPQRPLDYERLKKVTSHV